jgi:hypothetical protein
MTGKQMDGPACHRTGQSQREEKNCATNAIHPAPIVTDAYVPNKTLPDGWRLIGGMGFPPRRTPPRPQVVRRSHHWWESFGFGASVALIAASILFTGGY